MEIYRKMGLLICYIHLMDFPLAIFKKFSTSFLLHPYLKKLSPFLPGVQTINASETHGYSHWE